jgi:glucosyl-3-phosphoglycerate phosphatase
VAELTELVLIRHGESVGNVARERALATGQDVIDVDRRDPDVPLTDTGVQQAEAVGRWLANGSAAGPDVVYSSPYLRARQTAKVALATAGLDRQIHLDERLRDRELGVLDLLTGSGVQQRFPEEVIRRRWLGKLYYRPPGGESWADVALRLRSFISDLTVAAPDARRAMLTSHDAVIMLLRYVCEGWDEDTLLETAARTEVANASVTHLVREPGASPLWVAESFNAVEHLTAAPGAAAAEETQHVDRA